jgi:ABC-type multidrug transport system fused ATPase/permease subunit
VRPRRRFDQARPVQDQTESGQTVNVIGNEIDSVGGFVGTSISEFVVNLTLLVVIAAYMLYVEPVIAFVSAASLVPQIWLALYMQAELNTLVGRQVGLVRKLGNETIGSLKESHSNLPRSVQPRGARSASCRQDRTHALYLVFEASFGR